MFTFFTTQRRVAAFGAASAFLAVVTTACTDSSPLAPTGGRDASLAAQVAANDSLIRSASAATRRDSAGPGTASGTPTVGPGFAFPASLALSTAQQNQIAALQAAFDQQTAKDAADYNAILIEARNARAAGASAASIDAIIAKGSAIAQRLQDGGRPEGHLRCARQDPRPAREQHRQQRCRVADPRHSRWRDPGARTPAGSATEACRRYRHDHGDILVRELTAPAGSADALRRSTHGRGASRRSARW